jgi:hypothetical protein
MVTDGVCSVKLSGDGTTKYIADIVGGNLPSDYGNSQVPRLVRVGSRAIDRIRNYRSHLSLWLSSLEWGSFVWGKSEPLHCGNELENNPNCTDSTLLSNGADVSRGSTGSVGNEPSSKAGSIKRGRDKSESWSLIDVPTKLLSPQKFTKILYGGPRRDCVKIKVEASAPINIYGISTDKLSEFRDKGRYDLFKFEKKAELSKTVPLPNDDWYLILENESDNPIAVHYEVFDA